MCLLDDESVEYRYDDEIETIPEMPTIETEGVRDRVLQVLRVDVVRRHDAFRGRAALGDEVCPRKAGLSPLPLGYRPRPSVSWEKCGSG